MHHRSFKTTLLATSLLLGGALALTGCKPLATDPDQAADTTPSDQSPPPTDSEVDPSRSAANGTSVEDPRARARLEAADSATVEGTRVEGTADLVQTGDTLVITGEVRGLEPGLHGFHVHETGVCDQPDFESAGSHFDTTGEEHGAPEDTAQHAGDLGNLEAAENGVATFRIETTTISLDGATNSVLGRTLIVHQDADDLESQPSGEAGARIACGVIQLVPAGSIES